jgi:hypothetical protein
MTEIDLRCELAAPPERLWPVLFREDVAHDIQSAFAIRERTVLERSEGRFGFERLSRVVLDRPIPFFLRVPLAGTFGYFERWSWQRGDAAMRVELSPLERHLGFLRDRTSIRGHCEIAAVGDASIASSWLPPIARSAARLHLQIDVRTPILGPRVERLFAAEVERYFTIAGHAMSRALAASAMHAA